MAQWRRCIVVQEMDLVENVGEASVGRCRRIRERESNDVRGGSGLVAHVAGEENGRVRDGGWRLGNWENRNLSCVVFVFW